MSPRLRSAVVAVAAAFSLAVPAAAQQRAGIMGELMKDVTDVQGKLVSLAKAMPADKYDWRPGAGVRSVSEVYLHLASDNYLLPSIAGFPAPAASGIKPTDFSTLATFEKQKLSPDATAAAMQLSFAHLLKSMADTPDARLDERVKFFGQDMSVRQVWVSTAAHLHEHLGQSIAYARTNGITPPWSQKQ
ncbi:MAG: DinB family protein [bacterium]